MRFPFAFSTAIGIFVLITPLMSPMLSAQDQTEKSRVVQGGGITVPGWTGKIDAGEERAGQALNNAKLTGDAKVLHVTTGPGGHLLESSQQSHGQLYGKSDVHRAEVHEPE